MPLPLPVGSAATPFNMTALVVLADRPASVALHLEFGVCGLSCESFGATAWLASLDLLCALGSLRITACPVQSRYIAYNSI